MRATAVDTLGVLTKSTIEPFGRASRRAGAVLLVLAVLAVLGTAGAPAASAKSDDVSADTSTAPTMNPGQAAWVSMLWTAKQEVTDFQVTAAPPSGVTVGYPAGRAYTSLYGSSSLAKKVQDFTAFKLSIPYEATGTLKVPVTASWLSAKDGGVRTTIETVLSVPLVAYTGAVDLVPLTASVTVPSKTPTWVQLRYIGVAPSLAKFRLTVAGPKGLVVVYPGDGTSTGLNGGDVLPAGVTDYGGVRLDATALVPGTYDLTVTASFTRPGPATHVSTVKLVVT